MAKFGEIENADKPDADTIKILRPAGEGPVPRQMQAIREDVKEYLSVDTMSYNGTRSMISNPRDFYRLFILKDWSDVPRKYSMVVGQAVHEGINFVWQDIHKRDLVDDVWEDARGNRDIWFKKVICNIAGKEGLQCAIDYAKNIVENSEVVLGTTQNIDGLYADINTTFVEYCKNLPIYLPLDVNKKITYLTNDCILPVEAKLDLVAYDKNNKLVVVDHKLSTYGYHKIQEHRYPELDLLAGSMIKGAMIEYGNIHAVYFDQVMKGDISTHNVLRFSRQKRLREICDERGITYEQYTSNNQLLEMIDNDGFFVERLYSYIVPVDDFEKTYKIFVAIANDAYLTTYFKLRNDLPFIPNIFSLENGRDTYESWLGEHSFM